MTGQHWVHGKQADKPVEGERKSSSEIDGGGRTPAQYAHNPKSVWRSHTSHEYTHR